MRTFKRIEEWFSPDSQDNQAMPNKVGKKEEEMTMMEGWKDTVGKRSSGLFICCLKQLVCACLFLLFCLICGFKYFGWSRKMDERRGD